MPMPPWLRKLALAVHVAAAVGWVGAVVAYIPFDLTAATGADELTLRSAYVAMDVIARWAVVPLAVTALATGLVVSLGTPWGLVRHWWVLLSLGLTTAAVAILLATTPRIAASARIASDVGTPAAALGALGHTLPHSVGGLLVLLVVLVLNVYKPRGLTPYGWKKQQEADAAHAASSSSEPSVK